MLAKVLQDVQLPRGVVNIIFGDGPVTGSSLIKHPLVKGVSFTGGTKTGIQIRKNTVEDIGKHISLELGGKNPTLIFDDVDLEQAVAIAAKAGFENQGEVSRILFKLFVTDSIIDMSLWISNLCPKDYLSTIYGKVRCTCEEFIHPKKHCGTCCFARTLPKSSKVFVTRFRIF